MWANGINRALDKTFVYAARCNRKYEGDIRGAGDSVRIIELGPPTVSSYTKNSTTVTYSALDDASKTLLIDQAKYCSWYIDDVDRAMTLPGLQAEGQRKMAVAFADVIDQYVASLYTQAGVTANLGTTSVPIGCSSTEILTRIAQLGKELSDKNCPTAGRWLIAPPWFQKNLMLAIGSTFGAMEFTPNADQMINGFIARFMGFDIHISNNVPTGNGGGTTWYGILAGTDDAITFAGKLTNVEALRLSAQYGDGIRGLYCYGAKVVVNDALAVLVCTE